MDVALGLSPHAGWAIAVALGVEPAPLVVVRHRLDLLEPGMPRQVYHAARPLDLEEATELVRGAQRSADSLARALLGHLAEELRARGHGVVAAGVLGGGAPIPMELPRILAAHPLAHAAEGELFRRALADAAQFQGLPVLEAPRRDLYEHAAGMVGRTKAELAATLADLGKSIGPPWRKDEKEATLVAWLAVASAPTE